MTIETYNKLIPFKQFLYVSVELGTPVTNKHNEELHSIYIELGNRPTDLYCSGCLSQLFKHLHEQLKEYENSLF